MEVKESIECKVVVLAQWVVGKTCIINRYIDNCFRDTIATVCSNYFNKTLNLIDFDYSIKYQIWDTSQADRYRPISKYNYKDADAIILVYSIDSRGSFNEMQDYWNNELKENVIKEPSI